MLRITAGEFRGRSLKTPAHAHTRPTQSKVRLALFNTLQGLTEDALVLDLFAGSGALGFEALSRGAKHVTFLESHPATQKLILENAALLKVQSRVTVPRQGNVDYWLKNQQRPGAGLEAPFDLIFADPPYADHWRERLLLSKVWGNWLKPGGLLFIECSLREPPVGDSGQMLVKLREKIYGETVLATYSRPGVLPDDSRQC